MTGEDITAINNIIKAKKLSQLDLITKIADVDEANVVVIVPELDENGNIVKNENGNIKYVNTRITIDEFFRHGISSIWKTIAKESELGDDTLIPVITRNGDITDESDPINTRENENGPIVSKINKSKGATLGIIADKIVENKHLLSESEINRKIDAASRNINNRLNEYEQNNSDSLRDIDNILNEHEQNIEDNNINIQNIMNENKWLVMK